jgi:hypothetical protein
MKTGDCKMMVSPTPLPAYSLVHFSRYPVNFHQISL